MKIDSILVGSGEMIYTVELEEDVFVDVKCVGNLCYVMSCEDGYEVFNSDGNTFDYHYNEKAVIEFIRNLRK